MKKLAIALTLLVTSTAIHASDIGFIVKAGGSVAEDVNSKSALMLTVQVDDCQHCITGSYVHMDDAGFKGTDKRNGIGVDYLYKFPNPSDRWYYITGGVYMFNQAISDQVQDNLAYHAGAGMDLGGFVLAVDVFGRPAHGAIEHWDPTTLLSAGWHF